MRRPPKDVTVVTAATAALRVAQKPPLLGITLWGSYWRPYGERREIEWSALLASLRAPLVREDKAALPGWALTTFRHNHRGNADAEQVSALVLDLDDGTSIANARKVWQSYRGAIHTSFSHTRAVHRLRVILLLSRSVTREEHAMLWRWAQQRSAAAGQRLDSSCRNVSHMFFIPAHRPGAPYVVRELRGEPIDVDGILAVAKTTCAVSPGAQRRKRGHRTKQLEKPHKGGVLSRDRDWSRSGRDRLRAIQLVQQGLGDDQVFDALAEESEKYAEKLHYDDELIADEYLTRTIASARAFDAHGRTVAVIERAEQDIRYASADEPFRARVWMILRTREGERIKATMVVPSKAYPQARQMFDAVAPDLDPAALCDPKRWRLAHKLKGRELDVVVVDGQVRSMCWRHD